MMSDVVVSGAKRPSLVSQVAFASQQQELRCRAVFCYLMGHASGLAQDEYFAKMLAGARAGIGFLDERLGLKPEQIEALLALHFPGVSWRYQAQHGCLTQMRAPEQEDLRSLFLDHAVALNDSVRWAADVLVAGCMGSDHLWQDLGFWSRQELSLFIEINFPALFAKNDRNMKWKKFFYKQLCAQEGIYICRAPSCEVCADYADCFGAE